MTNVKKVTLRDVKIWAVYAPDGALAVVKPECWQDEKRQRALAESMKGTCVELYASPFFWIPQVARFNMGDRE